MDRPSTALAQQIASLAVDDLILLWYPSAAAGAGGQSSTTPAKFAILMNEIEPQSIGGITRLSWEAFPSQRLLEGSGLSFSEISDVSYEIRVHKAGERVLAIHRYHRSDVYRQSGIIKPGFELPFSLPSCEYIVWSVRAHFTARRVPHYQCEPAGSRRNCCRGDAAFSQSNGQTEYRISTTNSQLDSG